MLSKANANVKGIAPASEPAWKRRRDQSPPKQSGFYTPASSRSSQESKIQNPVTDKIQEAGNPKRTNLFQADWKSNDIAKAQGEAKRKDMEVLMNRFKTVSQTETEQNRGKRRFCREQPQRSAQLLPSCFDPSSSFHLCC